MANAARVHAIERGKVIGDCTLIAFGGAAPLHAARLAEKLGIARVIVPPNAGVGSAIGFLRAPIAYERVHSRYMRLDAFDAAAATRAPRRAWPRRPTRWWRPAPPGRPPTETRAAYMRYVGQGHEIPVPLPNRPLAADDRDDAPAGVRARLRGDVRALHPDGRDRDPDLDGDSLDTARVCRRRSGAPPARRGRRPAGRRQVFDPEPGRAIDVPIYWRPDLAPGDASRRARRSSPRTRPRPSSRPVPCDHQRHRLHRPGEARMTSEATMTTERHARTDGLTQPERPGRRSRSRSCGTA